MGLFDGMDFGCFEMPQFGIDDFSTTDEEDPIEGAIWTRPVVRAPHACTWEHAQEFADALTIDAGTETFAYVSGNFVFGDFVEALVAARKLSARRMGIQTLSMNDENIDSIRNICLMCGTERLDLVLSDYWYAHERRPGGLVSYLFDRLDLDGMELHVAFAGAHQKVWTIETLGGNFLTIQGSANLRSSGNVEQLHISPDPGLYEFCTAMGDRIIAAYDVVNQDARRHRSIRRGRLWQALATDPGATRPEEGTATAEAATTAAPASARRNGSASSSAPSAPADPSASGTRTTTGATSAGAEG